jgi:hypothetical protein
MRPICGPQTNTPGCTLTDACSKSTLPQPREGDSLEGRLSLPFVVSGSG